MAKDVKYVTLGELFEEQSTSVILNRLKKLAEKSLPEGWKDWTASQATKEKDFINKLDMTAVDRLTFALPTVGLVKAFDPEADHLSEVGYRQMRTKLLDWPFTRALITGPPTIALQVRGTFSKTIDFMSLTAPLKSLLLTREETDKVLDKDAYIPSPETASEPKKSNSDMKYVKEKAGRVLSGNRTNNVTDRTNDGIRRSSSSEISPSDEERLSRLEERFKQMVSILKSRIDSMNKHVLLQSRLRRNAGKVLRSGIQPKLSKKR
ncbi:hypothetical protein O0L34_g1871 [Tuta absoluta]|nr:hypothetical protein O0L34_g1871 [Tuta absoluta]